MELCRPGFYFCSRDCDAPDEGLYTACKDRFAPGAPRRLLSVLFAAQHDDPEKQDRQYRTNDSNSGSVHRPSLLSRQ